MKAATHTEVYRRFEGRLRAHPLPFLAIARSALRVGFKRKLAVVLLYAPPWISSIVFSFIVYTKFSLQEGRVPLGDGTTQAMAMAGSTLISVSELITRYVEAISYFALLVVAWYGSGSIAEDRRMGAHLLYFSRPITRFDYLAGKLLAAMTCGALAVVAPALAICWTAAFSSPHWSFVTEQGHVILETLAYTSLWVLVVSTIVVAVSAATPRKTMALAAFFGWTMLSESIANVLAQLAEDDRYRLIGLLQDFWQIGAWTFGRELTFDYRPELALLVVAGYFLLATGLLLRRLRAMELAS